jgi:hypothetical protein
MAGPRSTNTKRQHGHDDDIVRDPAAMLACLRRMKHCNGALAFYNQDHSMKFLLRNDADSYTMDSDDDAEINVDFCIAVDEADERMAKLLDMDASGYFEDPSVYVLESFCIDGTDPPDGADCTCDELKSLMRRINDAFHYALCHCGAYIVKDRAPVCLFCQMTAGPDDRAEGMCAICQDECMSMHAARMPCCGQALHRACLKAWRDRGRGTTCPLCQQALAE